MASLRLLRSRIGFEVELLAPRGSNRFDFASVLAHESRGSCHTIYHHDSEPSLVPGMAVFQILTHGQSVLDAQREPVCTLVDDITIQEELDGSAPASDGRYRIVSDEGRLLRLVAQHCDPDDPLETVLRPLADLYGTSVQKRASAVYRVNDESGATVAMAAPQGGERERVCEVVTPPLERDHGMVLESLLAPARRLGFTVPTEAAVHLHLDAEQVRTPEVFANMVRLFGYGREALRELAATNLRCRRLGPWPEELFSFVEEPGFSSLGWDDVVARLAKIELSKYCDVNLVNVLQGTRGKDTIEFRFLPGSLETEAILDLARLIEAMLHRCMTGPPVSAPGSPFDVDDMLQILEAGQ